MDDFISGTSLMEDSAVLNVVIIAKVSKRPLIMTTLIDRWRNDSTANTVNTSERFRMEFSGPSFQGPVH